MATSGQDRWLFKTELGLSAWSHKSAFIVAFKQIITKRRITGFPVVFSFVRVDGIRQAGNKKVHGSAIFQLQPVRKDS